MGARNNRAENAAHRVRRVICIANISKTLSRVGWQDYELRVNDKVIATFRHKREDGLTKCLQLATEAAERSKWQTYVKLMNEAAEKRERAG